MIDKQLKKSLDKFIAFYYITEQQTVLRNVGPKPAPEKQVASAKPKTARNLKEATPPPASPCPNTKPTNSNYTPPSTKPGIFKQLKDFLNKNFPHHNSRPSFASQLIKLIAEKGLTEPAVYKAANMDRKLFSKIRQPQYHPSKNSALALVIALKLTTSQADSLLRLAGYTLSCSPKTDVIIMFCLENEIYDIILVNELLQEYTGKTL